MSEVKFWMNEWMNIIDKLVMLRIKELGFRVLVGFVFKIRLEK